MSQYYYLGTVLTPLKFEEGPPVTFKEFNTLLKDNLSEGDYEKIRVIRRFYDILNVRSLWKGEELDPLGELDEQELDEALVNREGLQDDLYIYLDTYEKKTDRLKHFPRLLAQIFRNSSSVGDPFLRKYLKFERELRLVCVAFRTKTLGWDLGPELQYEDPEEEFIAQLLAQKDAKSYEPPESYQELKVIFNKWGNDPLALQKALDKYRFDFIESQVDWTDQSSIKRILAYMIQLLLIQKWSELDHEKGKNRIDTITTNVGTYDDTNR